MADLRFDGKVAIVTGAAAWAGNMRWSWRGAGPRW